MFIKLSLSRPLLLIHYIVINFQEASSILETIYSDYANSAQKAFLIQEFYGADFAFFKVIIENYQYYNYNHASLTVSDKCMSYFTRCKQCCIIDYFII